MMIYLVGGEAPYNYIKDNYMAPSDNDEEEDNDALIKKYRKEAEERRKQDAINTNILASDDPTLQLAQDIILGYAVGQAVDAVTVDLLKDSFIRAIKGNKAMNVPFKQSGKSLKLGPKAINRCIKAVVGKIKTNSLRVAAKLNQAPRALKAALGLAKASKTAVKEAAEKVAKEAAEKLAQEVAEKAAKEASERAAAKISAKVAERLAQKAAQIQAKVAARAAIKASTKAAEMGTKHAAMAGACAVTGPGCVAVIALEVLLLAFDAINIALDIIDEQGYSVVIYKPDIKAVEESTMQWMNDNYNTQENPNYMSEEIFFDWENFLYEVDEDEQIVASEEWGTQYAKYQDEYMKKIGIEGDWRSRVDTLDVSKPTDPGVLSSVTLQMVELKKEIKRKKPPPKSNKTKIIVISILAVVFVVIIILLVTSTGDDGAEGSEPSTNNSGGE
jgi:hypothetical protein